MARTSLYIGLACFFGFFAIVWWAITHLFVTVGGPPGWVMWLPGIGALAGLALAIASYRNEERKGTAIAAAIFNGITLILFVSLLLLVFFSGAKNLEA